MADRFAPATNLAFFLLEKTGAVCGEWRGRMTASDQRALFGEFLGKGLLVIDGAAEEIRHRVGVAFGHDYDYNKIRTFRQLCERT